jgi:hypothetical protein
MNPTKVLSPVSCVHCGKTFYGPRLSTKVIRDRTHMNQMAEFYRSLKKHLADDHPQEAGGIMAGESEFSFMMTLSRFRSNDAELQKTLDMSRWNVHQNTLAVKITDAEIGMSVEQIIPELMTLASSGDQQAVRERLTGLLVFMRDQLQEPDKYSLSVVPVEQPMLGLPS